MEASSSEMCLNLFSVVSRKALIALRTLFAFSPQLTHEFSTWNENSELAASLEGDMGVVLEFSVDFC